VSGWGKERIHRLAFLAEKDTLEIRTRDVPNKESDTIGDVRPPYDSTKIWVQLDYGEWIRVDKDSLFDARKREEEVRRMKMKEESPLTGATREVITVDGEQWERYRGEYRFRKRESPLNLREEMLARMLERQLALKESKREVLIDLRDPGDYELVEKRVDSLIATERPGFYRVLIDWDIGEFLREHGIAVEPARPRTVQGKDVEDIGDQDL
jgi:hypothetical protein